MVQGPTCCSGRRLIAAAELFVFRIQGAFRRSGSLEGVEGLHHLHVWELDEQHRALEAHVVIARDRSKELARIKRQIKSCLSDKFQIRHSTLEFEFDDEHPDGEHDTSLVGEH